MIYAISAIGAAITLVLGYFLPWTITPIIIGLTYAIAALGVSVMMRAGQVSFGHAMYACISAYSVAFLARAWPGMDTIILIIAGVLMPVLARSMHAGQVYINSFGAGDGVERPFGGVKKSGHGCEKGFIALEEMSTIKTIIHHHGA